MAVKAGQEGAELAAREALVAGGKVVVKAGQEGSELVAKQALLKGGQEGGELALITTGKAVVNKAEERRRFRAPATFWKSKAASSSSSG